MPLPPSVTVSDANGMRLSRPAAAPQPGKNYRKFFGFPQHLCGERELGNYCPAALRHVTGRDEFRAEQLIVGEQPEIGTADQAAKQAAALLEIGDLLLIAVGEGRFELVALGQELLDALAVAVVELGPMGQRRRRLRQGGAGEQPGEQADKAADLHGDDTQSAGENGRRRRISWRRS